MGTNIYKIENDKPTLVGYVKSDEEVNKETSSRIREKYSLDDELKILRLKDSDTASFDEYNNYVEQCRTEGKAKKDANAEKIAGLKKVTITEDGIEREIYVEEVNDD